MMSKPHEKKIIVALMKRHGRTFSRELGIEMGNPTSSALFPTKADELAKLVPDKEFPRLLAALIRCRLAKDSKEVLSAAQES
jgi:hypothetical protein